MAQELSQRLGLPWLSKDAIKEKLYDTVGFRCRGEKVALGEGALEALYYTAGQLLQAGVSCILENNFEEVSKPGLLALLER
jgi:predicted kinase